MQKIMFLLSTTFIFPVISMDDTTKFFEAVKKNEIAKVENLIKEGKVVNVNVQNNDGDTALMIAVKIKSVPLIKELLLRRASLNTKNNNGFTALTLAIEAKDLEIVKVLLHLQEADLKQKLFNKTPLMLAIETGNIDIIKEILNEVPDPAILNEAINFTKTDEIHNTLSAEKINKILDLIEKAKNQYILYEKIKEKKSNSDISDIKNFIDTNSVISLNVQNKEKNPLGVAIDINNINLVNFLIKRGANVNQILTGGNTLLMEAILKAIMEESNIEMIKSLLENGADPNLGYFGQEYYGTNIVFITPLYLAFEHGLDMDNKEKIPGLIKLLVKYKAKIDDLLYERERVTAYGKEKLTLLMLSITEKTPDGIQILLEAGANPLIQDRQRKTALDIAREGLSRAGRGSWEEENYTKIVDLLNEAIAKTLLTSLQNLTQSLTILQNMLL